MADRAAGADRLTPKGCESWQEKADNESRSGMVMLFFRGFVRDLIAFLHLEGKDHPVREAI